MFWVMGRREVCGALTLEGVPCQNGPGCRVAHPPVPLATSLEAAGVLEAGPGADPLGAGFGDGGPPRFVDPRDPSVAVGDLDDVSLAFAAGRFGVVPAAGPGWRERMVTELRAKVAAMAPLDWRPVTVPWRGYWDRDSAQGTMVFALDPGLVGDGDDPTKVFRSAFQARVLAWAVDHPDGALNQLMFNWGDCLDCAPAEGEGAFGVFYVPVDDPAAAEVPTGSMVVLDEVDYDETILTFDDEDVLAEVVDGFRDRWPELADRVMLEFCPRVLASDPATSPAVLERLAAHPDPDVRAEVAGNESAPPAARSHAGLLAG